MNKIHALIIVRNYSDCLRLNPVVTELSWTSRVVDLNQLTAALVTRRFDWIIAIDIPADCEDLFLFLNHFESSKETKNFNFININHDLIDVSYEKLKKIVIDLYQQLFWITYGDAGIEFSLSEELTSNIRCGHSRFQTAEQAKNIAIFLSQLTHESNAVCDGLSNVFMKAIESIDVAHFGNENLINLENHHTNKKTSECLMFDDQQSKYTYVHYSVEGNLVSFDIKNNTGSDCQPFLAINSDCILDKQGQYSAILSSL